MGPVVRFVTLNLWGDRGPLPRRLGLVAEELRALGADVIALQEVREVPGRVANTAHALAQSLGMECSFAPAMEWGGGVEGIALLTREPLGGVVVRELPHGGEGLRRVVLAGVLSAPGVVVATTHLHYRLEHGMEREDQVLAVDALLRGFSEPVKVLLGDLNAVPDSDEVRFLLGKATIRGRRTFYQDAWALLHPEDPGLTWAKENPFTHDQAWLQPGRRIDYVFVSARERDGRGEVLSCELALCRPGEDGVFPSDHFAVVADVRVE